MKILVVGSGGREHAIVWKLKQSPKCTEIFCAPGNAGIAQDAECVKIAATDIPALVDFAKEKQIDLTVIGMDDPLMLGVVDAFEEKNLIIFGPRKKAAELEGSKDFAKSIMKKYGVPTADYATFDSLEPALSHLKQHGVPIVIKADGLAAGKGVTVAFDIASETGHIQHQHASNTTAAVLSILPNN